MLVCWYVIRSLTTGRTPLELWQPCIHLSLITTAADMLSSRQAKWPKTVLQQFGQYATTATASRYSKMWFGLTTNTETWSSCLKHYFRDRKMERDRKNTWHAQFTTSILLSMTAVTTLSSLRCFDAVGWATGRASSPQKLEWWGAGMVICLEQSANDLHMVRLMPLPSLISASVKCRMVYPSGTGLPR